MKQTLKTLIRNVKSIKGNSLAEFATTTALMATLAATAAPKLSEMSEGAKAEKSRNEIDKIIKQGGQFYQDTADTEGRGRFPGQDKFNKLVGTGTYAATAADEDAHETAILTDIGALGVAGTYATFNGTNSGWTSVFGKDNVDVTAPNGHTVGADDGDDLGDCNTCPRNADGTEKDTSGPVEWLSLFGEVPLASQYQDGHFVYQVVAGYGSGNDTYPPVLYVADIENAADFNNLLEP